MRRILAIAARFLLFHVLSVLVTAVITAFAIQRAPGLAGMTIRLQPPPVEFALRLTGVLGPFLLIPSALGWWAAGALLDKLGRADNARPALQGASAGLAAVIAFWITLAPTLPNMLGIPIGAFFGWLVYRKLWPTLPAAAPDQPAA